MVDATWQRSVTRQDWWPPARGISCPLARSYLAVSVQDLMAADSATAGELRKEERDGAEEDE